MPFICCELLTDLLFQTGATKFSPILVPGWRCSRLTAGCNVDDVIIRCIAAAYSSSPQTGALTDIVCVGSVESNVMPRRQGLPKGAWC